MSRTTLDTTQSSNTASNLIAAFSKRVVGCNEAVAALVDVVEHHQAGFDDPTRPAGSLLFLGPTGAGKTRVVESMAYGMFGSEQAMIKIDCAEFQHSHEIAKLIGSPPGYLGHRETHPLLTQEAINQWFTETCKFGIVLFDEIEKASDSLWALLLGILDKATLTLGDNRRVNFSDQVIIMTSNLGSSEMGRVTDGGIGFNTPGSADSLDVLDTKLGTAAVDAAKRKFTTEFFNRVDRVVVFKTLTKDEISKILDMELGAMQTRLLLRSVGQPPFFLRTSPEVKLALIEEGYSAKYGAREIKRVIRRRLQSPLARIAASGQVKSGEVVCVEKNGTEFEFFSEEFQ